MRAAWLVLVAGCGRVAFEPLLDEDAGADVGTASRFCATRPDATFCEDFDHPSGLPQGWDSNGIQSVLSYDAPASSFPRAMRVVLPASGTMCRYARLDVRHDLPGTTSATLEFAYRLANESADPGFPRGTIAQFAAIGMPNVRRCVLLLHADPSGRSYVYEQDYNLANMAIGSQTDLPTLAAETFTRVKIEMVLGAAPEYSVWLDDDMTIVRQAMRTECAGTAAQIETNMGIHCQPPETTALDVRLDDIVLTHGS